MSKRDGRQKGPQQHAEGQHGELTHARFLEQLHQSKNQEAEAASQQHGDADSGSERNGQRG